MITLLILSAFQTLSRYLKINQELIHLFVQANLLAGQHGEGGEEDHGAGAAEGRRVRLRQDPR